MVRMSILLAAVLMFTTGFSSCDDLPSGDVRSPDYWADFFLDKYADELDLERLEGEEGPGRIEEPRVVLLITGITIRAEWFDLIAARLTRDGFIPVVYEPPELLSYDLFEASYDLAEVVEQVARESGQERIDILAECTGGVIARHYIQSLGGDEYVSRMVTFVSPQAGVDKAPLAAAVAGWPALHDLTPGSEFLTAVAEAPLPDDIPFTSIYTCGDEYIQPWQNSIIPGATNIGLCDEFVAHFQTFYDPAIYEIMYGALTEPTIWDEPIWDEPTDPERPVDDEVSEDPAEREGVEDSAADDPVESDGIQAFDEGGGPDVATGGVDEALVDDPSEMGCSSSGGGATWLMVMAVVAVSGGLGRRRLRTA